MEVLREIQDTVKLYATILSEILKMDVSVVDTKLWRVAGTGCMAAEVDTDISEEGHVFANCMRTGKTQIIDIPGKNEICLKYCSHTADCKETFHMSTPIMDKGNPIGAICFTCYNKKQREHALKNKDSFQKFLQQFADLIALKAVEKRELQRDTAMRELLKTIVNHLDAGVLVLNSHGHVIELNDMCCKILRRKESTLYTETLSIFDTGNQIGGFREYRVNAGDTIYHLVGRLIDLGMDEGLHFLLFKQAERTMKESLGLQAEKAPTGIANIKGESPQAQRLKQEILRLADSPSCVLVTAEKGLETEHIVRAIHEESSRKNELFYLINCASENADELDKELFGIAAGKNSRGKIGKIEAASKGTLVLEDIDKMPLMLQRKIWKFLENGYLIRLGGNKRRKSLCRLLFTSSTDLETLSEEGSFLYSLYYRISALVLRIPPLRDRQGDIHYFVHKYLQKFAVSMKKEISRIDPDVYRCVDSYPWPGNLWELRNAMEYAINMMSLDGNISMHSLPNKLWIEDEHPLDETLNLEAMEQQLIKKALAKYIGSPNAKKEAAAALGIGLATLYRKIKKYELENEKN